MKITRLHGTLAVLSMTAIVVIGLATYFSIGRPVTPLAALAADPQAVTISGISSGGFFAVQAQIAYSSVFKGVAAFGAGPYYCGEGNAKILMERCITSHTTSSIPTNKLTQLARQWSADNRIESIDNLASANVYLFTGANDKSVSSAVTRELYKFYAAFVPSSRIQLIEHPAAGHAWISPYASQTCDVTESVLLNNCQIDPQQEFLTQFYGSLHPKNDGDLTGKLTPFDQLEFLDDHNGLAHSVSPVGWIYTPASCLRQPGCRVHVALHGCMQEYAMIGDAFVKHAGLNQWADSNRIIVVYPQILMSREVNNFYGCWDIWGYDGPAYAWKSGKQITLLKRIVDRLTSTQVTRNGG